MKISLIPTRQWSGMFDVIANNGVVLGNAYAGIDGYIVFKADSVTGEWTAEAMRAVADALDAANVAWDFQVQQRKKGLP